VGKKIQINLRTKVEKNNVDNEGKIFPPALNEWLELKKRGMMAKVERGTEGGFRRKSGRRRRSLGLDLNGGNAAPLSPQACEQGNRD
jgi:hypothetical protein